MLRAANAFTGASHTALHHRASTARTTHFQAIAAAGDSVDFEQKFKAKQGTNARAAALMEEFDFPLGLAQQVVASAQSFPTRFWIVDDSGSMATGDGKMISTSASGAKSIVGATRWQEISADMAVAAAVSHEAGARTEFHPLNGGRPLTIQGTDKGTPRLYPSACTQHTRPGPCNSFPSPLNCGRIIERGFADRFAPSRRASRRPSLSPCTAAR